MSIHAGDILENPAGLSYHEAMLALSHLPDRCALDVTELARRIGADKLERLPNTSSQYVRSATRAIRPR